MVDTSVNNGNANQIQTVMIKEFAAKYSSKKEVYAFLAGKCKIYLAGYDTCSIYFLQDIATGVKKRKLYPLN